jgi:hypothetical protein
MEKREFVIAKCAEGLSLFDQECKDKEGKGYPVIDKQVLYDGKQTCKAIDMCGIQAHAGYYIIGSDGKEFEFDIDKYPLLYLTMKAEKDTDTCLLLMVHEKKPRDFMRRFVALGTTDSEKKHCGVRPAEDYFTIKDDNKWHDYTYDLRKLRGDYPDAETVRMVQFYSGKICNGIPHAFHFSSLLFKKTKQLVSLEGFEYIKLGQVGSKSEGPIYYLQTLSTDYVLVYEERNLWEKDYYLEFYNHKMVEVSGELIKGNIIKVNRIRETCASHL